MASMLYSLIRVVLDAIATSHHNEAKLRAEVLALRQQVQVLERQIKRVRWEPADRMIQAALRERLPRSAWAALLVKPETVLGWHRELVRRRWVAYRGRPRTGRPPLAEPVRELIVRMARENPRWGYFRIRGDLLKLGFTVSATTVRSVLRGSHVTPAGRRSQMSWRQFLTAHAESLVATDFFTVDTVFFKRLYVLFFVHLATRRVVAAACTAEPNSAWVAQQARNLSWKLSDEGINVRVVVHDRDRKFARGFDSVFEAEGARVILTPLMAPRANAHAECWVGSARRECLDWMLIVSQRHLETVVREYCAHYNDERPHRSCGLRPPAAQSEPIRRPGTTIRRRARLGGLLNEYSRAPIAA
jgi:putative transposase